MALYKWNTVISGAISVIVHIDIQIESCADLAAGEQCCLTGG